MQVAHIAERWTVEMSRWCCHAPEECHGFGDSAVILIWPKRYAAAQITS